LQFFPGVSYRNLLVYRPRSGEKAPFSRDTRATPPHDLTDREVTEDFPRGPGSDLLCDLMGDSVAWFAKHPVNESRIANGKRPATNVWLWGLGKKPRLGSFRELYGIQGAMITAVDLLRGLAELVGWENITVPGATGYLDTDYAAKGRAAIAALQKFDLVCVHIEAPDEAAHQGDVAAKISAIEEIDQKIIGPILEVLQSQSAWRMLVTPDHPTPCRTKTHSHGDVPFVVAGNGLAPDQSQAYGEAAATASSLAFPRGFELWHCRQRVPANYHSCGLRRQGFQRRDRLLSRCLPQSRNPAGSHRHYGFHPSHQRIAWSHGQSNRFVQRAA